MLEQRHDGVILCVKVTPKARKTGIEAWKNGELHIRIQTAPEKGAANQALVSLLAKTLHLPKSRVLLLSGQTSRHKRFLLQDASLGAVSEKLPS